jgi:hypothetical protein
MTEELTFQFFGELCDLFLIFIVGPSGMFQVEFTCSNFVQLIHHLVLEVFNLVFKSGDLGGKPVSGYFQVSDCPREHVSFKLGSNSGSLLLF